jgi:hypothetical protein
MEDVGVFFAGAAGQIASIPGQVFATLSESVNIVTSPGQEEYPDEVAEVVDAGNEREMMMSRARFIPSTENGVYIRTDVSEPEHSHFVDFQIILNEDELRVLLSRKKSMEREDLKDPKSLFAANAIGKAAPFVDARRLTCDIYRGENVSSHNMPNTVHRTKR